MGECKLFSCAVRKNALNSLLKNIKESFSRNFKLIDYPLPRTFSICVYINMLKYNVFENDQIHIKKNTEKT